MKLSWFIILLLVSKICSGQQNLVPNPGFETLDSCPSFWQTLIVLAPPWFDEGSIDMYNTCATNSNNSVPSNQFGYQDAHSGNGYGGGAFYNLPTPSRPEYREYLKVPLDSALVANENYCASFYVSPSYHIYIAINSIGAYFSETPISDSILPLNLTPQVKDTSIISDTTNWTLIQGQFIANGGEKYMIIGNFTPRNLVDTFHFAGSTQEAAYYYVDDVEVYRGTCGQQPCISMSLAYSLTDATPGINDGAVKVIVTGGNSPYLYSLDSITFQSSSTFTGLDTGTYQIFVSDSNGCPAQGTFTVTYDTTVSTQSINSLNPIKVFPNPFSDELFIELEQETSISLKLIDVLGRVVLASQHENTSIIKLDIAQIQQGVYYLEILNNKGEKLHTTGVQIKAG